jgi:hypothetical protein
MATRLKIIFFPILFLANITLQSHGDCFILPSAATETCLAFFIFGSGILIDISYGN